MAHAEELGMVGKLLQLLGQFFGTEIHPANDALDEFVVVCELQQPPGFLQILSRLHGNAAVEVNAL